MKKIIHCVGIGGIGISALARWLKAHGYDVRGSDIAKNSTTEELAAEGIPVVIGKHKKNNCPSHASRVIYNQAIDAQNPELVSAKKYNIPIASYPQALGELTSIYKTIAIAGAHGKSTTTAIVALILERAKYDPTVIVGTKLKEFKQKNFRKGNGEYLIIEADEWKGSFLHYLPYAALITNIDREHLDYYKNLGNIKRTFIKFLSNVHPYGLVVLNEDNPQLVKIKKYIKRPIVWYSTRSPITVQIKKIIKIPGMHNLENATGAYMLTRALGIKKKTILQAISEYNGAWRRSEYRGKWRGAQFFDDYGHHPTEIRATLLGFKEKFPDKKLVCVFQPHQRERLKLLFKNFVEAFDTSDALVLVEVYDVAGRESTKEQVTTDKLAAAIEKRRKNIVPVIKTANELKKILRNRIHVDKNTIVLMIGAGNINEITDKLLR